MYDTETRTAFIELRAKGWGLKRIAARLKVAPRTLVDWNRQERDNLRTLRAIELEALQEKILAVNKTASFLPRFCLSRGPVHRSRWSRNNKILESGFQEFTQFR